MNANCTVDDLDITKANPRVAKVALTGQRRRTYPTREAERQDALKYIELFYNSKRKHTHNSMLSPTDFKARQQTLAKELGEPQKA